jgi:MFS transporter, Spinster family, sphingosine-1-phosphate transporter
LAGRSGAGARTALAILTLINLFNYLDRYVVASLVESLKKAPLLLSDTEAGSLMTGFVIVYMLTSPIFGRLGDRRGRPRLLALGVGVWSVATALGGLARSFTGLFAARAAVGVGEAAYGTIAPALLADHFPREKRGRVFAVFFAAIPIGSAAGYVLGGLMDQRFGWRAAFFVAGVPGLLLALLCLGLKDPPRGAQDEGYREEGGGELPPHPAPPAARSARRDVPSRPAQSEARGDPSRSPAEGEGVYRSYSRLLKNRGYRLTVLGYAAYTFALGGLAFWAPAFLERIRGMPKAQATVQFGSIVVVTGFVGTFVGGWAGDYFLRRSKEAYLWVSGWATLAAAPAALVAFVSRDRAVYMPAIVVTELLLFASTGPINSAIVNAVAPTERATAVALSILGIHLLGDVPSPPIIGALSDATSLGTAFLILPAVIALAGGIWLYASRRGRAG